MKILSCVFVIIGVIIGAGFASGKEIYTFFYIYGEARKNRNSYFRNNNRNCNI